MIRIVRSLGAFLLLLSGCALPGALQPTAVCGTPGFPYAGGWLGGDAAYSVPLSPGRSVWLFGDSFVGPDTLETRVGATLVHNSIAVSQCRPGERWQIAYDWTAATNEQGPRAFFASDDPEHYWWLFDGFVHEGALYIGLLIVEPSDPRGPLNLPFRYAGMKLARIENPSAPPGDWSVDILPLSSDPTALPAGSMVIHDDHVYLFGFLDLGAGRHPRMLARIALSAFAETPIDLPARLEYLAEGGDWRPGLDAARAQRVMDDNASEMSVRFHPELGRWVAVYGYPDLRPGFPEVPPSGVIRARTAERLEGPWSAPKAIHHIPELQPGPERDPNTFCYAAKEHPELARAGEILITYVCNLFTPSGEDEMSVLGRLLARMDLYRPVVVTLPLETVLGDPR